METTRPDTRTAGLEPMAVVSVACAVLAAAGLYLMGMAVLAVFAVGAGHMALHRIERRGRSGQLAALAGLSIGYAVGVFGLAYTVWALISLAVGPL
ncbi:hypothetical protein J2T22_001640 [Pseudarthrobacter defluvii]|uniref:DUF4190 domain-containing protein n=1 Tax=Pseudarthrobacter defluvii TaxID=410837 RepID=A0ABT9UFN9_9MICC|nr:hypothetical protein [Pseudarthrobacter defluvii]MDQ0118462.1 hypothetical protein [Pseudarthrobacter defluvii]